ncbi:MAG TPA: hypothetical protein VHY84_27375 [Bryobacteraceae bacterium]|nr:hypothetical protein [Bryobacteraceae bacterium]
MTARLSNATNGFNAFLPSCIGDAEPHPFEIDFSPDSQSFLSGKYNIVQLFDDSEITLPAIAIYQGSSAPATTRDRLVGNVFSGFINFGLDVHLMSAEGQSQTDFDLMVSAVHDTVINTFNVIGASEYAALQIVWSGDIAMGQPSRVLDEETGQYLSTLPFRLSFYCPV